MLKFISFIEEHKVSIGIVLALIGFIIKYVHDISLAKRKANLERVNSQLKFLYGPLYALSFATNVAWKAFRSKQRPGGAFFRKGDSPNDDELSAWRLWMTTVFGPLNRQMVDAILKNSDLLHGEMPSEFLDLIAHVKAYEPVLKKWEKGNYTEHLSVINFPKAIENHITEKYKELKKYQANLLGQ